MDDQGTAKLWQFTILSSSAIGFSLLGEDIFELISAGSSEIHFFFVLKLFRPSLITPIICLYKKVAGAPELLACAAVCCAFFASMPSPTQNYNVTRHFKDLVTNSTPPVFFFVGCSMNVELLNYEGHDIVRIKYKD